MTTQVDWVLIGVKATINSLHDEGQTWRKIAAVAGVSPGLVHHIAHGRFEHASWETVRQLSSRLLQSDPGPLEYVLACPTCGGAHVVGDCGGVVGEPVLLAPGERVAAQRKPPQVRTLSDYPSAVLARLIAQREAYVPQP